MAYESAHSCHRVALTAFSTALVVLALPTGQHIDQHQPRSSLDSNPRGIIELHTMQTACSGVIARLGGTTGTAAAVPHRPQSSLAARCSPAAACRAIQHHEACVNNQACAPSRALVPQTRPHPWHQQQRPGRSLQVCSNSDALALIGHGFAGPYLLTASPYLCAAAAAPCWSCGRSASLDTRSDSRACVRGE